MVTVADYGADVQVQALLLQLVKDPSQDVVDAAFDHLLPALLKWMAEVSLLHTSLLPAVLSDVRTMLDRFVSHPACTVSHSTAL